MEDFVTFEIAKKLKEKGFPQYIAEDAYIIDNYGEDEYQIGDRLPIHLIPDYMDDIVAPTISQVLKWLREEKLILIGLSPMQEYDGNEMIEWCSTIYKADKQGGMSWMEELYYESYEQAALAGIEYVLDNLI